MVLQQKQAAIGRAGNKRVLPGRKAPRIHNMEPVDILVRGNGIDHRCFVNLVGKRQLDENAVDTFVGIEVFDDRQQFGLAGVRCKTMFDRPHASRGGALDLVAHIDRACRVVTDKDDCQCRWPPDSGRKVTGRDGHPFHKTVRKGLAVNQCRFCHDIPSGLPPARCRKQAVRILEGRDRMSRRVYAVLFARSDMAAGTFTI